MKGSGIVHRVDDIDDRTFSIVGTSLAGAAQTETVTGLNTNSKTTTKHYSEITKITIGAGKTAGNVSAGWAAGSNRSADRVVKEIAFSGNPGGNVTLTFVKSLMTLAK